MKILSKQPLYLGNMIQIIVVFIEDINSGLNLMWKATPLRKFL